MNPRGPPRNRSELQIALVSERSRSCVVAAILVVHLMLTTGLAWNLNLWLDEAYSLHSTQGTLLETLRQALTFELQPPLYFLLLDLWRGIHPSPAFARLLSILCVTGALIVIPRIWRGLRADIHPGWITASMAFHPFLVWCAVEIRGYALIVLLSALLMLFFFDGYLSDRESARTFARAGAVVVSVLALYTQYYLGFLLVAQGSALLVLRRWRALRSYLLDMVVVFLFFSPMLILVPAHFSSYASQVTGSATLLQAAKFAYSRCAYYVLPRLTESPVLWKKLRDAGLLLAMAGFIVLARRAPRKFLTRENLALSAIAGTLTISFASVFFAVGSGDVVLARHTACLFIPIVLLMFSLSGTLAGKRGVIACMAIVIVFDAAALRVQYAPMAKQGDWRRVASALESQEAAGQPILVFPATAALPLAFHYAGRNALHPLPVPARLDAWDPRDSVLHNEGELARAFLELPDGPGEYWLVTETGEEFAGVRFGHEILEAFLKKHFAVERSQTFFQSTLRLLRKECASGSAPGCNKQGRPGMSP